LAAITFLVTGLVFFVAHMEGKRNKLFSQDGDGIVTETVLVNDADQNTPTMESFSRDS
jgi:hypothetical protein